MAVPTPSPIKRGLVRRLRQQAWFTTVKGGIHQSFAPYKAKYPFITYQLVTAPSEFTWGGTEVRAMFDVFAWSVDSVEAENLDALIAEALHDAALDVGEQRLLLCRRMGATPTGPTTDSTGRRIYQIGGSYAVWTDTQ